jgi:hypothetical protein
MKYSQIIVWLFFMLWLVIFFFLYNGDISSYTEDPIVSSWEINEYNDQLEQLLIKTGLSYSDIIQLAQTYEYLWYFGKSIVLYEDYLSSNTWWVAMYHNLWRLYEKFCYDSGFVRKFCKKSIYYYQYIIDSYNDKSYYKEIARIYVYLKNKKQAEASYEEYTKNTWLYDDLVLESINAL